MPTPVILLNGAQPPPLGNKTNGTINKGTSSAALSLASTLGIGAIRWVVASKPSGSTCALSSEAPSAPFGTVLGPFDVVGTYIIRAECNANASKEYAEIAITVLDLLTGLRKPAVVEEALWDPSTGWAGAWHDLLDWLSVSGGAAVTPISDANTTLTPAQYGKRFLRITGTLTADRYVYLPAIAGAFFVVKNETTGAKLLGVSAAGGTVLSILAPWEIAFLWCDGSDYHDASERFGETVRLTSVSETIEYRHRTIAVDTSGSAITITLPANPKLGQRHTIYDAAGNGSVNNITIDGNGKNISGLATAVIASDYGTLQLSCFGTGWVAF